MVTKYTVKFTTKVANRPFYGKIYNMVISNSDGKIFFKLKRI